MTHYVPTNCILIFEVNWRRNCGGTRVSGATQADYDNSWTTSRARRERDATMRRSDDTTLGAGVDMDSFALIQKRD